MPIYTLLPTLMEGMVEAGWTAAYAQIEECSSPLVFIARLFVYLLGVEFCIYWIHRSLHDYKILYQYLHAPHHIYNKGSTLSPFAGGLSATDKALTLHRCLLACAPILCRNQLLQVSVCCYMTVYTLPLHIGVDRLYTTGTQYKALLRVLVVSISGTET